LEQVAAAFTSDCEVLELIRVTGGMGGGLQSASGRSSMSVFACVECCCHNRSHAHPALRKPLSKRERAPLA
jgi:hypothetical protein